MRRRPNSPCSQTTSLTAPKPSTDCPLHSQQNRFFHQPAAPTAPSSSLSSPFHFGPSLSLLPCHRPPLTQSTVREPPASGSLHLLGCVSQTVPFPLLIPASPEQPLLLGASWVLVLSGTWCLFPFCYTHPCRHPTLIAFAHVTTRLCAEEGPGCLLTCGSSAPSDSLGVSWSVCEEGAKETARSIGPASCILPPASSLLC